MGDLKRRQVLQAIAALIGSTGLPDLGLAATVGAPPPLLQSHRVLLSAVADTLIPRTDSPGAVDAGVPATCMTMLTDWASANNRASILSALDVIEALAKAQTGKSFASLPAEIRHNILAAHDLASFSAETDYRKLRDLIVFLFYMSEPGATIELRYVHVPGAWIASMPLTPESRTWAGAGAF